MLLNISLSFSEKIKECLPILCFIFILNNIQIFGNHLFYLYIFSGTCVSLVLIACVLVFAATMLIKNWNAAFFVYFCILCVTFDMIGLSYLFNRIFGGF